MPETKPVLIIGAGVSGLTLAQACRKLNLPFKVFERDPSAFHRSAGWGLTIHWALPTFKALLPDDIIARFPETFVNREAVDAGEKGNFTFFDLSSGEARWKVPAAERIRVYREKLRKLLLTDLDVRYDKALCGFEVYPDGVVAIFSDGTKEFGSMVVGCDGASSVLRGFLHHGNSANSQLPVRFIGAGVHYTSEQVAGIRKLDPYFLQGSDPRTDAYLWFSFLETPSDGLPEDQYYCQIMVSWPYRAGWLGRLEPTEMPDTTAKQLSLMKRLAEEWAEPFRSMVQDIPGAADIKPIELADWLPRESPKTGLGRVALVGDAAATMVMYRGEGANHAIVSIATLLEQIRPLYVDGGRGDFEAAVKAYEEEMIPRTELAVLASRQACLDAHEYERINENSPLVRRRLMRADLELDSN